MCAVWFCQRYYNYIHCGIDTDHVAPMEASWLQNILGLVPTHLRSRLQTIEQLSEEITEDYLFSMKKSIGTPPTTSRTVPVFDSIA